MDFFPQRLLLVIAQQQLRRVGIEQAEAFLPEALQPVVPWENIGRLPDLSVLLLLRGTVGGGEVAREALAGSDQGRTGLERCEYFLIHAPLFPMPAILALSVQVFFIAGSGT